ncbi:MAG: hypothetical protein Q7S37_01940 [bacterium]|nr:hypothetical protein [bacterium]
MRDNKWLEDRLYEIWKKHFQDIEKINRVYIRFGRANRNQLGSIVAKGPKRLFRKPGRFPKPSWWLPESFSIITMNSLFKNPQIPNEVIDITIAHELVHYAHGFSSPHPQLYRYPHSGSIVTKELIKRGLKDQLNVHKKWLKTNWKNLHC